MRRHILAVLLAVASSGCSGDDGTEPPPAGRLEFTVEARTLAPGPDSVTPFVLTLIARNGEEHVVDSGIADCPLTFSLHPTVGAPPSWQAERGTGWTCEQDHGRVELEPGESRRFEIQSSAAILGDSLRAGTYHVRLRLDGAHDTYTFDAGTLDLYTGPPRLELLPSLPLQIVDVPLGPGGPAMAALRASIGLVNSGGWPTVADMGDCALTLSLHDATASPVWQSVLRERWQEGGSYPCLGLLFTYPIAPGDTVWPEPLTMEVPLAEILADSLPVGRYSVRGHVAVGSDSSVMELGDVDLPVSSSPLISPPYLRNGVIYDVSVTTTQTELRVGLTMTHSGMTPGVLEVRIPAGCPFRLLAFRSDEEREEIPMPAPAWVRPVSCGADVETVQLALGESETREVVVPWAEIQQQAPDGTYLSLAAVVRFAEEAEYLAGHLRMYAGSAIVGQ